jgi:hypothetical protein
MRACSVEFAFRNRDERVCRETICRDAMTISQSRVSYRKYDIDRSGNCRNKGSA